MQCINYIYDIKFNIKIYLNFLSFKIKNKQGQYIQYFFLFNNNKII